MRLFRKVLVGLSVSWPGLSAGEMAQRLTNQVQEPGLVPYLNRILVTDEYLRMDEGGVGSGLTLLDRQQAIIYSVSDADKSVLVLNPPPVEAIQPQPLALAEQVRLDAKAPTIDGRQPRSVVLRANGESCREMVVVNGLMPEAVDAELFRIPSHYARIGMPGQ